MPGSVRDAEQTLGCCQGLLQGAGTSVSVGPGRVLKQVTWPGFKTGKYPGLVGHLCMPAGPVWWMDALVRTPVHFFRACVMDLCPGDIEFFVVRPNIFSHQMQSEIQ